ncbi:MAG: hypothetical protein WAO24_07795 [Peptococcia bacterium]
MFTAFFYLTSASILLAFVVTWQTKTIDPNLISIAKYNLKVLPLLYLANTFLGLGINTGHKITNNLPLMVASQGMIYNLAILVFSILILSNKASLPKSIIAFLLISTGLYLLKS